MPRRSMGKAQKWTDKEIAAMSEVGPEDVHDAREWWRANAGKPYRELLDAEAEEPSDAD